MEKTRRAQASQEFDGLSQMIGARGDHLHRRLFEPRAHVPRRFRRCHGIYEGARIGGDADKAE